MYSIMRDPLFVNVIKIHLEKDYTKAINMYNLIKYAKNCHGLRNRICVIDRSMDIVLCLIPINDI